MKRIATAAIAIPVALLITIYSPDWLLALIAGLLSALMLQDAAVRGVGFLFRPVW
jgi:hypothetical protein